MMSGLGALLYRERRRLLLVAGLAFLAGALFYWPSSAYVGGIHVSLVTGAIYALVVGTAALTICWLLPTMRFMMEAVAIARLALALLVLAQPELRALFLGNPFLMALVVVGGGLCISRLMHGRLVREPKRFYHIPFAARQAAVLRARPWQHRLVSWLDDAEPVPA